MTVLMYLLQYDGLSGMLAEYNPSSSDKEDAVQVKGMACKASFFMLTFSGLPYRI